MSDTSDESVRRLRDRFLAECVANSGLYHPIDIERVRSDDWEVRRYVVNFDNEDDAFKGLIRVLKWKKSFGLHDRSDDYFPKEFHLIFGHEDYSRDRKGRLVAWNVEDRYRKIGDLSPLIQQFLAHQLEKLDRNAGPDGWVSINDCSKAGMASVDMNMSKFRTESLNYYPGGMQLSLNVDMPWILRSAFKVIKGFITKKIRDSVILITREEIVDYVEPESIPECFGGQRQCSSARVKSLEPLQECKHLGLNEKQIETFYQTYKDYFQR